MQAKEEIDVSKTLAAQAQMAWIDLSATTILPDAINLLSPSEARRLQAIPVCLNDTSLIIAIGDPFNLDTIDRLGFLLRREIELVCTNPKMIQEALINYYGDHKPRFPSNDDETGKSDASIIRLVSNLITEADRLGASDIHLEPLESKLQVRLRVDGILREMQPLPKRLQSAVVSRIKIMTGSISIAERRLPQDGRIQARVAQKQIDLRVSTIPTNHGESVVMRLLDKSNLMRGLSELGLFEGDRTRLESLLRLPDGIVLVTGPTGSGKTSTLYSCLHFINQPECKIITVEDPVEYQLTGINQVQVNTETGLTFPVALRSILRQAPNIIMIGEIRDRETATIATNASLTGHLVFSTLHTNDAPSAVARLLDMGVQPFLVASSLRAVLAQRLVRCLCRACRQPSEPKETVLRALHLGPVQLSGAQLMQPTGCAECHNTGFKGRTGIYEILVLDNQFRHLINQRASTAAIRQHARANGMRTLREDGVRKVLTGVTSIDEVLSTTMGDPS